MTTNRLRKLHRTHLLNLSEVCKQANVSYDSVYRKMRRRKELSALEAEKLGDTLKGLAELINPRTFEDLKREKVADRRKTNQTQPA